MPAIELNDARIAETAFLIWKAEGQPEGKSQEHWFRAVETLKAEAAPKKKAAPRKAAKSEKAPAKAAKAKTPAKPRARKTAAK